MCLLGVTGGTGMLASVLVGVANTVARLSSISSSTSAGGVAGVTKVVVARAVAT